MGPLPHRSAEALRSHSRDQMHWGALHWREWMDEYGRFRAAAARLIGSEPHEISILKNTSEGISFVAEGFRWSEGDNVVTTDLEFPSNFVPWKRLERKGVQCRVAESKGGAFTVDELEPLIDERTRIVAVSSVQFHNGFAADLVAIGDLCAAHNVFFCVDAIQSLGQVPMDVRKANISFLAADSHKWLLGPEGAAIFFCSEAARDQLVPVESGWMNIRHGRNFRGSTGELLDDGRRFEAGSLSTGPIYGATTSMALLEEIGIGEIEKEVIRLASRLAAGLERSGLTITTPQPIRSGIVAVTPPTVDSERLKALARSDSPSNVRLSPLASIHRWLESEGVVCSPREGSLRFSPHFYNDDREVDRVIELMASLV